MIMNKLYAKMADVLYKAARVCEGKSFNLSGKNFMKRPIKDYAGVMGTMRLDMSDAKLQASFLKGLAKKKRKVRVKDGTWKGKNSNSENLKFEEPRVVIADEPGPVTQALGDPES